MNIKIQTPDGKTLNIAAPEGASQDELHQAATAAAQDYASKMKLQTDTSGLETQIQQMKAQQIDPAVINAQQQKLADLQSNKPLPMSLQSPENIIKSGLAGAGNLVAGQGWQEAAANVQKVGQGQEPTNLPGKVGSVIGTAVSPQSIATAYLGSKLLGPLTGAFAETKAAKQAIQGAEEGANIVVRAPKTAQMAAELGLGKGQTAWSDVINTVNSKLANGEQIPLQTAKDFLLKGKAMVDAGKAAEDGTYVALVQALQKTRGFLNANIPGRAEGAVQLASSAPIVSALQRLGQAGQTVGLNALKGAGWGLGGTAAYELAKSLSNK